MSQPRRFLVRMTIFLVIVAIACGVLLPQLKQAFLANALFNGLILGVLLLGVIYIFRQVLLLRPEVEWMEHFRQESSGGLVFPGALRGRTPPRLLGPLANMVGERKGRLSLSTLSMRSLLDGIQSRINESHEISRYLIGLLIFLGLLGTFWGLLETVNAVAGAIGDLTVSGRDPAALFGELKSALQEPLTGMGTAFSSSLFGLAGSLVLGFLELQAGQAHNRFVNELEEWLSGITKLGGGGAPEGGGGESVPAYIQALLEQTADSLDTLQRTISAGEEDRSNINQNLIQLTERLSTLTDQMRTEQSVLMRVAETQSQLKPILGRIADAGESQQGQQSGVDDATKDHIRNLDVHLERMLRDTSQGRDQVIKEIRSEIRLLARTIAAIAEEGDRSDER